MLVLKRALRFFGLWMVLLAAMLVVQPGVGLAMPMPGDGPPTAMDVSTNTGDATMSIPIPVPPGTGGFAPELALRYSSSGGDGPFGVGWSLEFGEIRRSIRFGNPSFNDSTDRFELGGQLLVLNPADSTSTQTRYHTSAETFVRILHIKSGSMDKWEMTRPDGVKLRFGLSENAVVRKDDANTSSPIFRWMLEEMEDPFGNVLKFVHAKVQGEAYPQFVYYTYRNGAPVGTERKVAFIYALSPYQSLTFMGGVRRNLAFRVDRIEVSTGSTLFRKIQLTYAGQPGSGKTYRTGRSRLAAVQMFGVDGTDSLPPQKFEYRDAGDDPALQGAGRAWSSAQVSLPPGLSDILQITSSLGRDYGIRVAQVNSDGIPDLLVAFKGPSDGINPPTRQEVYLGNGVGWNPTPDPSWSAALQAINEGSAAIAFDASGCGDGTDRRVSIENRVFFADGIPESYPTTLEPGWRMVDVNGDGLADLLDAQITGETYVGSCSGGSATAIAGTKTGGVWLNTGSGWSRDPTLSSTLPAFQLMVYTSGNIGGSFPSIKRYSLDPRFEDLNGDGRVDLVVTGYTRVDGGQRRTYQSQAYLNTQSGWARTASLDPPRNLQVIVGDDVNTPTLAYTLDQSVQFVDLNRDGLADMVQTPTPAVSGCSAVSHSGVWINTGTSWCDGSATGQCSGATERYLPPAEAHFTANGEASYGLDVTSDQTLFSGLNVPCIPLPSAVAFVDLNGDGLDDLVKTYGGSSFSGRKAWIHNPAASNVWVEDPQFRPPLFTIASGYLQGIDDRPTGVMLLDFNADGAIDTVAFNAGSRPNASGYFSGGIRHGDIVSKVENGRGGVVEYGYASATKQQNPTFNALVTFANPDAEGVLSWSTAPVVSSRTMSGLDVDSLTENYTYGQPRFHIGERMSLGFGGTRSSVAFNGTDRIYEQRLGVAGRSRVEAVFQLCEYRLRTTNTYETLTGNDPGVGSGSTGAARVGRLIGSTTMKLYGNACTGSQTTGSAVVKTYEYDPKNGDPHRGFNFVTRTTTSRRTGTMVETRRMRAPDTTRWIVGLPERTLVTSSEGELSKMEVAYGNEGRPTEMKAYEGARGNLTSAIARTMTMSYDAFGNIRSMTDPATRTTALCFDGDSTFATGGSCSSPTNEATHSVMVAMRDPLQEVTTFKPDATTGMIMEKLRVYSGDRERVEFDGFGRMKRKLFQAASQSEMVLTEAEYFKLNGESDIAQEHVIMRSRLLATGTESLRVASYLDGFGREARRVDEGPRENGQSRYFGVSTRRNMAAMQITTTLPASCESDRHCVGLAGGSQPRQVVSADVTGMPLTVAAPTGVSRFDYRSVTRTHPDIPGPQQLDAVLEMDPRGYLTQRIFDGDELIWMEECGNAAIADPANAVLSGVTCQSPAVTFYRYEATGELREIYDALASSLTDPNKATLRFVHDSLGRVTQTYDINKTAVALTAYDAGGKVSQETNARGQVVSIEYDALDRPKAMSYPMGAGVTQEYSIDYDPRTRLERQIRQRNITSGGTSTIFTQNFDYDPLGRVTRNRLQYGSNATLVTETDFDLSGRATRKRYPDLNTEVAYEYEGGYLRRVCELAGTNSCSATGAVPYLKNVNYDGIGREAATTGFAPADNSYTPALMTFTYNSSTYQLDRFKVSNTFESIGAETLDLSYGRDAAGNITSTTDNSVVYQGSSDVPLGANYTYDARSRVASWTRGGQTKYFTYNSVGNLTGKQVATVGATNQTYDTVRRHRVTQANGMAFSYDADGNVIQRGTQQLTYDPLNRMTGAGSTAFAYGVDGLRVAGGSGSTLRIYVGDDFEWEPATGKAKARIFALGRQVAAKMIGTATLRTGLEIRGIPLERIIPLALWTLVAAGVILLWVVFMQWGLPTGLRLRPVYGSVVVALSVLLVCPPHAWAGFASPPGQGTYRRWIWQDPLGTSLYVTDEVGLAVDLRAFDPFGGVAAERTTESTERTFAGHPFEDGSGLYYMKARWYDPVAGRFLSIDPMVKTDAPQSLNAYSYVENNPINVRDPTGMAPVTCDLDAPSYACSDLKAPQANEGNKESDARGVQRQVDVLINSMIVTSEAERLSKALGDPRTFADARAKILADSPLEFTSVDTDRKNGEVGDAFIGAEDVGSLGVTLAGKFGVKAGFLFLFRSVLGDSALLTARTLSKEAVERVLVSGLRSASGKQISNPRNFKILQKLEQRLNEPGSVGLFKEVPSTLGSALKLVRGILENPSLSATGRITLPDSARFGQVGTVFFDDAGRGVLLGPGDEFITFLELGRPIPLAP